MKSTARFADISHYEPDIEFHEYAAGGCPLVITKCSEGRGYTDPTFAGFAERARTVPGLMFGSYVLLTRATQPRKLRTTSARRTYRKATCSPLWTQRRQG